MTEDKLDAIARRLQQILDERLKQIEQELAILRREQAEAKAILEKRLDRLEAKLDRVAAPFYPPLERIA